LFDWFDCCFVTLVNSAAFHQLFLASHSEARLGSKFKAPIQIENGTVQTSAGGDFVVGVHEVAHTFGWKRQNVSAAASSATPFFDRHIFCTFDRP
jgi:hypothetical protein